MNRAARQIRIIIVSVIVVFLLASCGDGLDPGQNMKQVRVTMILKALDSDYWKTVKMGAEVAAGEFHARLTVKATQSELDADGQVRLVDQALESDMDALIIAAADYMALGGAIDRAGSRHVPVITVDAQVGSAKVTSYIGADHYSAGKLAGQKLIQLIGTKGRVAVLNFSTGAKNAEERAQGLYDLLAQYPDIVVVDTVYTNSDQTRSAMLTSEMLGERGPVQGIVALNAPSSIGAAKAIHERGMDGRVKLVAFESTPDVLEWLQEGTIQATIVNNPFIMGYLSVKNAVSAAQGMPIPERIDTETTMIDVENMLTSENQKLLFPFVK